ncbi:ferritin-like domain-containing protein [Prosthecobacter sp. SYSU 5D2]|uniref:ferritin-like domain-containing protein n=1 Tax=Prosthecobacter sp. SYSU 5D2 TaxID=3134134 RepID=UPI0031FEA903
MNTQFWIHHFQTNASVHDQIRFEDLTCTLPDEIKEPLAHSLAIFQLGESGTGSRLRRYAREVAPLENFRGYQRAIDLFVCEEQAHSRLLGRLVQHLGGKLLQKQWTNSVFRRLRFLVNLEFAIQVLLTAELIAEVYYGTLFLRVPDEAVRNSCRQILKDEMKHLEFQRQFLGERLAAFTPVGRYVWACQFRLIHALTTRVVAWDHRACLKALGMSQSAFVQRCEQAQERFQARLETWSFKAACVQDGGDGEGCQTGPAGAVACGRAQAR